MYLNDLSRFLVAQKAEYGNPFSNPGDGFNKERFQRNIPLESIAGRTDHRGRLSDYQSLDAVRMASFFWEAVCYSEIFSELTDFLHIDHPLLSGGRLILTMHQNESSGERHYDLLILSTATGPEAFAASFLDIAERLGYGRLRFKYPRLIETLIDGAVRAGRWDRHENIYGQEHLGAIAYDAGLNFIFAPMPPLEYTSGRHNISTQPCRVSLQADGSGQISTAGVFTTDTSGRTGITAALHGIVDDPDKVVEQFSRFGAGCVLGKTVYVNGVPGKVLNADLITDSCFIAVDAPYTGLLNACGGPLRDRPPYPTEKVSFGGITSGTVHTNITEMDIHLPNVSRNRQAMVYTKPVTNKGDSGAALLNLDGNILGFNHARTGYGAPIEMAEWVWADSVYNALELH